MIVYMTLRVIEMGLFKKEIENTLMIYIIMVMLLTWFLETSYLLALSREENPFVESKKDKKTKNIDNKNIDNKNIDNQEYNYYKQNDILDIFDKKISEIDNKKNNEHKTNTSSELTFNSADADLVFDVRFLPNPFYVTELRRLTGLNQQVRDYVFQNGQAQEFLDRLFPLFEFLLPHYVEEGKTALVIAVGCTGGHHRSVAIAHEIAQFITQKGYAVTENHRDLARG